MPTHRLNNTRTGFQALYANTNGNNNTVSGYQARFTRLTEEQHGHPDIGHCTLKPASVIPPLVMERLTAR